MNTIIGSRLKLLREKRGYSQKFVAEKIGVKNNTLSGYEAGRREPDSSTLNTLADFYKVSVDYLLGRTDNPNSDISIAYDGGPQYEDEDEREFIEQQLEQYRKMKKRMQERLKQDKKD
ncbi:helix-turn-helix transcriptional regulator [Bacillus sp. FSL K6-0047]